MWIEVIGLGCCAWTLLELGRLVLRAVKPQAASAPRPDAFGAWDGHGDAIDVDVID